MGEVNESKMMGGLNNAQIWNPTCSELLKYLTRAEQTGMPTDEQINKFNVTNFTYTLVL